MRAGSEHGIENDAIWGALTPTAASGIAPTSASSASMVATARRVQRLLRLAPPVLALEPEGGRDGEEGGRVVRAAPAEPALERLRPGPRPVPGDDRAAEPALRLGRRPDERAAARGTHPLVQVARIDVATDRREVEVDLPGTVRAVDDRDDAALAGERAEPRDRQHEGAQGCDLAHEQDARTRGEPCRNRVEELVLAERRPRQRRDDDLCAGALGHLVPEDALGPVLVVGQQDLVAAPELDAPRHRVEPCRDVRNEPEVVSGRRADVAGDALPDAREPGGEPAGEEQHRFELELAPQLVLPLEDGARHGTEAAVVQVGHLGVEHEQLAEQLGARCHAPSLTRPRVEAARRSVPR